MVNHQEISSFIWNVCDDVLRGLFKQHEYGDVILPFVVLRRLDCVIEPKKDEVDLKNVSQRMSKNLELELVMVGQNSDDDKKDFFNKLLKDEVSEYYGDRLDFYKKIMNTKVFPMILEGMYREYGRGLRK